MARRRSLFWLFLSGFLAVYSSGSEFSKYNACRNCSCGFSPSGRDLIVECHALSLEQIPRGIPPNTTILDLSDNTIKSIQHGDFSDLTKLRHLYLQNNKIKRLPQGIFDNLKHLKKIKLEMNDIITINKGSFLSLSQLEYLNISCNRITKIESQSFPDSLRKLDLHDNALTSSPSDALTNLKRLHYLSLLNVSLKRFPNLTGSTSLQVLTIGSNDIKELPTEFCQKFPNLKKFYANTNNIVTLPDMSDCKLLEEINLEGNEITTVDLQGLANLIKISLKNNTIKYLSKNAFKGNSKLSTLILAQNNISQIPDETLQPLIALQTLDLRRNKFKKIPTQALKSLTNLQHLKIDGNAISEIHNYAFEGLTSLSQISLNWAKVEKVHEGAFRKLPALKKLSLLNVKLTVFPDLTETNSLEELNLESNSIKSLPKNFCEMFPKLYNFNVNMNRITSLPDMSKCKSMELLHLVFNRITSIGTSLQGMERLTDITLKQNVITEIPRDAFKGLKRLENLHLAHNKITKIDEEAFVPLQSLKILDLTYNDVRKLPSKGMSSVRELYLRGNKRLNEISADSLPNVRLVEASYPYHCCEFRKKLQEVAPVPVEKKTSVLGGGWTWAYLSVGSPGNDTIHDDEDLSGFGSAPVDPVFTRDSEGSGQESLTTPLTGMPADSDNNVIYGEPSYGTGHHKVNCTPLPDPFFPCDDLMGSWLLRVGVWIVFMLALLGNAVVVIVIILSKTKVDVSKFLIMNLAAADLCMGIYLGCLAIVDASTIGNFRHHGVDWQQSLGCKSAGFLAVLSSEASVFTLAVITIERYIAIRHALHVDRKMSLRKTAIVMASGWVMAFIIATLPLVKVSDYTKFSICLPFETSDAKSLGYVTLVLSLNFIAFVVIFGCYVRIYFEIRGSNAWNTSDTQVAMRMALLVVTDFFCWAPIVIIALPAAFGSTFVSLEQAKVFTVFIFPLNSCANPFLYAIFTYQFKKDCMNICRRVQNSPVPPMIQITLTKKRLSMSGIPVELRQGSRASDVACPPETHSDGKMTLRIPSFKFNRRYSLPATFKLSTLSPRSSGKNSAVSSEHEQSRCSHENSTEQTLVGQEKTKDSNTKKTSSSENLNAKNSDEVAPAEKSSVKEKMVIIDRRTAV